MRNRKYRKNDKDVRTALWIAYDRRDIYTSEPIKYREMEVDHIIPESIFKDVKKKEEVFELLGLDNNFQLDSLENYAPTTRKLNASKGNEINPLTIQRALEEAKKKKNKVEKLIDVYNKEDDYISLATKLSLLADTDEKKQDVADIIFDEEKEFRTYEKVIGNSFVKSICRVQLQATLPTITRNRAECEFRFRPLKLRECTIIVSHNEIFEKLFVANGEFEELTNRPFITSKLEYNIYIICLGRCVFSLNESETIELCEIIDKYNLMYFKRLSEFDRLYFLNGMKVNSTGEIKLCTLSKEFCRIVFEFINSNKENPRWNIFEANRNMIKVYTDSSNKEYSTGYHAIIDIKELEDNCFWYSERDVSLWLKTYYIDDYKKISDKDWWNPIKVIDWLFMELFPESLKYYFKKNRKKKPVDFDYIDECKKYYRFEESQEIKIENRTDMNEIDNLFRKMQCFYSSNRYRKLRFENGYGDLYKSFLVLLESCTKEMYIPYMAGKLGVDCRDINGIKCYASSKTYDNGKYLTYGEIELLLRCFIECIEKGLSIMSQQDYVDFWKGVDILINEYNYHMVRERFL